MVDMISRFGENKQACAMSYLFLFVLSTLFLSKGWIFLSGGLILLLVIFVLVPSKDTSLKFHAIQAILLNIVTFFTLGIVYLFALYGGRPGSNFMEVVIHIGTWVVLFAGILLVFLILTSVLFFRAWRGKRSRLPLLGEWAATVCKGDYTVLKWVIVFLGIVFAIGISSHYQKEENQEQPLIISQNLLSELTIYLRAFPMGSTQEEVYQHASEIDGKSELRHSQQWGTDYKEIIFCGYPADLLFRVYTYDGNSSLQMMKIKMQSKNVPIKEFYWQLHKELTAKYGIPLQEGQPPWCEFDTKVWESGEGALWKITLVDGKPFMLMISLKPEQQTGDGRGEFYVECRMKNK